MDTHTHVCVLSHRFSCVWLFATLRTVAHQPPLSMGFSRQEWGSGLPFRSPGDFPDPGSEHMSLMSPALANGYTVRVCVFLIKDDSSSMGFPGGSVVKNPPASAGDTGLIHGLGRSPGEGNGNMLQYSFLDNSMDRGAWQATVQGVARSQTQFSN